MPGSSVVPDGGSVASSELVWNTADATMRFFSQSKGICESFEEIIRVHIDDELGGNFVR